MSHPTATVLIPTFNHGETLRLALQTALTQTVPVEVFIIGDGVSEASRRMILELAAADARIRFFDHPKHESRGEPYRHVALREARGRIVCYMCDRDLWMPDHVERLAGLLGGADFAHSLSVHVLPGDKYMFFPADLAIPQHRRRMLTLYNRVAFSCAAHTLDFYRSLSRGWETTPRGKATDWHMFQQFLEREDCRCVSGTWPSAITFPSPPRIDWTVDRRLEEMKRWAARIAGAEGRRDLVIEVLQAALVYRDADLAEVHAELERVVRSRWWQMRRWYDSIPVIPRLLRKATPR